ncbi:putative phospholipid ABC transporter-binding protein MlaD [Defluviimonas aquaemixtae]|uniref:Putative phospholipid ABC transporter-binding protein MlaD n=1 Tax=Albidovulum aquaemixtae TaxID=1542388 RepID=A0A2R8B745_9RHOB|nr:outer membrane lipid asymmetry maintenance protein MlaD [Defluviimonas aquaemixtae]SPH18439.1 putative phospholipid ABC transporter-binding protein MlaD [Defluviimonas aquaemixtae]
MSENVTEVVTGAGVLAVALGFLVFASDRATFSAATDSYELVASFRSVEGVTVGTDVRMAGVKVGTITDLALNPTTFFADARLTVRNGIVVPDDSTAVVASEGLLGGAFVEILPGGSPIDLDPGAEIENTQGSVSVIALLMKFVGAASGDDTETAAP